MSCATFFHHFVQDRAFNNNLPPTKVNCAFFIACILIANNPFRVKKDPLGRRRVKKKDIKNIIKTSFIYILVGLDKRN